MVDRLRVQRSEAKEESAGFRAQADSAAAQLQQLQQLQKAQRRLKARYEALLHAKAEGQGELRIGVKLVTGEIRKQLAKALFNRSGSRWSMIRRYMSAGAAPRLIFNTLGPP